MALLTSDLLYAHGCLCEYAKGDTEFDNIVDAIRLMEVINHFQTELKDSLIPDAKPFEVSSHTWRNLTIYTVQPKGGW